MSGARITALSIAVLWGAVLGSPLCAQDEAMVVALKQPISVVGYSCKCNSCKVGFPCGGKTPPSSVTEPICCLSTLSPADCDAAASCGAGPGCGVADFSACATSPSRADVSCGPCDSCGGDSQGSWLTSVWPNHHRGCKKCNHRFGNVDCCCFDLCKQQGCWLRTEALLWWTPKDSIPTLATSSPLGTPIDDVGVLGLTTTTPISSDSLFGDMRGGGRVRFGKWAGCGLGFEGSGWILGNDRDEQQWQSNGDPALARPFTNVDPIVPGPDSQLIGFDGVLDGTLTINSSSEIHGGDIGIVKNLLCCSNACSGTSYRVDGYAGYRYFRVREGLRITEDLESVSLVGPTVFGTTIDLYDDFQTRNEFHGGNIGMSFMRQRNRWTAEMISRIAFGNLEREVRINGRNTVTVPNLAPVSRPGGLLTQPTNIGVYQDNEFEVLPEFQLNLGYAVSCHAKLTVGYTFLYLGDVVRPGDVIDTTVNGLQLDPNLPLVGPTSPEFAWHDSDMWLMGLTLGAEFNF